MKIRKFAYRSIAIAPGMALLALAAYGQVPQLIHANIETRAAAADFPAQFAETIRQQQPPAWLGYSVASVQGNHRMCCGYSDDAQMNGCGACRLEDEKDGTSVHSGSSTAVGPVELEGPQQVVVLFRAESGRVDRIRTFSEDCQLDAGGLPVVWFTRPAASQTVAALAPFITSDTSSDHDSRDLANSALLAVALTGDPSADKMLQSFVARDQPERLREHAAFWLGAARGHLGYQALQKLAREDSSEDLRAKVAFDLYVSRDPEAAGEMIRMAKNDQSSHVREQAIFWIAQRAGKEAASTITEAIENDPDTEVKKRAVFALSQLPREQGVPLLIQVAKTNANPAVRKQAIFWLGQSHDPRALAFFEEILAR